MREDATVLALMTCCRRDPLMMTIGTIDGHGAIIRLRS